MTNGCYKLGDLCDFVRGTSATLKTSPGPYPLVVTADFRRTADTWQLEGPAVCIPLISSTGHGDAALHRVHYQEGRFALATLLVALIPKDPLICHARYLYHLLMTQKDTLFVPLMLGTANVSLKEKDIALVEVTLPPMKEQRRIVARIEVLAAQVREARAARHNAIEDTARLWAAQLARIITPSANGWRCETLSDVIVSMDAGWSPQCGDHPAGDGEWGVLKTTAVQWCEFRPHENKALPPALVPAPGLAVAAGDVLITRAGPRKRVGVVAAVPATEPMLTISDKIIRVRPDRDKMEPRFLEAALASPFSQDHLVARKTGLADAQVNITQSILRSTPIAYPELHEQHRIIEALDELRALTNAVMRIQGETTAELDALLPAILDRAFRGEL